MNYYALALKEAKSAGATHQNTIDAAVFYKRDGERIYTAVFIGGAMTSWQFYGYELPIIVRVI
jgi:hypothetical protein